MQRKANLNMNQDRVWAEAFTEQLSQLKAAFPTEWRNVVEQLSSGKDPGEVMSLARRMTASRETITPERLHKIALSAIEGR